MKQFAWNADKNARLAEERGVSFEAVVHAVLSGHLLDDLKHPNTGRYPKQRMLVVRLNGYAWLVPYVETPQQIFLKTIIPSRKATKRYLGGEHD